jgi:hypothetical protein
MEITAGSSTLCKYIFNFLYSLCFQIKVGSVYYNEIVKLVSLFNLRTYSIMVQIDKKTISIVIAVRIKYY